MGVQEQTSLAAIDHHDRRSYRKRSACICDLCHDTFCLGETKLPNKNLTHGVWVVDTVVHQIGLKTGDKILAVNDKPVNYFDDMNAAMLLGDHMTIDRDGQQKNLVIPVNFIEKVVEKGKRSILLLPRVPCVVGEVGKGTPAEANGLLAKDQIIGIDSHKIEFYDQLKPAIQDRTGDAVQLHVLRDGKALVLNTNISKDTSIGFYPSVPSMDEMSRQGLYTFEVKEYSFFASLPAGVMKAIDKLGFYVTQFKNCKSLHWCIQRSGRIQINGFYFSKVWLGLGSILEHHCVSIHRTCFYEFIAHTGIGWWTCYVYPV